MSTTKHLTILFVALFFIASSAFSEPHLLPLNEKATTKVFTPIALSAEAPVIADIESSALTFSENQAAAPITASITITDADNTTLNGATVTISSNYLLGEDFLSFTDANGITGTFNNGTMILVGSASIEDYQAALRSITYANTSNAPSIATRTIQINVIDDTNTSNTLSRNIDITPINDAPVLATLEASPITYNENAGEVTLSANIAASDIDNTNLAGATVAITAGYVTGQDVLSFVTTGAISGSFNTTNGTLTLTGSATLADYNAALRAMKFANNSENPTIGDRTIQFSVSDGTNTSNPLSRVLTVAAANDAPVLASLESTAIAYNENAGEVTLSATIAPSDIDNTNLEGATIAITSGYVNGQDVLSFVTAGAISGNFNATNGTLTLTGSATVTDYNTALRAVKFTNNSENPTAGARTIQFSVTDGTATSNALSRTLIVTAGNDAPVLASLEATAITYNENAGEIALSATITASDVDNTNLAGATVAITSGYATGQDVLSFVTAGAISGTFNAGTLTLTGSASVADYNTALRAVKFANSSENPTAGARTIQFSVTDGTATSNALLRTLNVAAANDAPVLASLEATAIAYNENAGEVALSASISASDIDNTNLAGATITITAGYVTGQDVLSFVTAGAISGSFNATNGTLTLTGSATIADYNTALRAVKFANNSENPTAGARNIQFSVSDGAITSNALSRTLNVAAANDAPVLASLEATAITYNENVGEVALSATITASDIDNTNLAGATIAITSGYATGQDVLSFVTEGAISGSFNATNGTLTLTGSATVADYNTALRAVKFANSSENPTAGARTIQFSVTDGAITSNALSRTLSVTAANDAPVLTSLEATAIAYNENDGEVALSATIAASDVDNTNLAGATIAITAGYVTGQDVLSFVTAGAISGSFSATNGTLTLTGSATVADYNTALRAVKFANSSENPTAGARTIQFSVTDGAITSNALTRALNVAAGNDAPVLASLEATAIAYNENAGEVALSATIAASDVDNTNLVGATIAITAGYITGQDVLSFVTAGAISGSFNATNGTLTLTGSATVADYNTALRAVKFTNSSKNPTAGARTIQFSVSDGAITSNALSRTLNVAAANDAPVLASLEATAITYNENVGEVALSATITASDIDNTNLAGATIAITAGYATGQDVLSFVTAGAISGSFNATNGTLTLTGSATVADYNTALRAVKFTNNSENPTAGARNIQFSVTDGAITSNALTRTLNVAAGNDAPVLASLEAAAIAYNENDGEVALSATITASDVDNANLAGATIAITSGYVTGQDVLSFVTAGAISGSFNATNGTLTLTGSATIADYNTALRAVKFANSSENPTAGARTILFSVTDGAITSNTLTRTLNVAAGNDAPVLASLEATAIAYNENAGEVALSATIAASDVDNTNLMGATIAITSGYVTGQDVLSFVTAGTISGSFNATNGTLTLTGSATIADYNTALRAVKFANGSENPTAGARTIQFSVTDGAITSNALSRTLNVTAGNDAPVLASLEATPITYNENAGEVALSATIAASDIDNTNLAGATVYITSGYVAGQDVLSFVTAGAISGSFNAGTLTLTGSATVADYNSALRAVKFANNSENPTAGARTIQFSVTDGTATSNALSRTLNVTATNDLPTVTTVPKLGTEDVDLAFLATDFTSKFTDTDGSFIKAKIVTLPANGTLKVLGVAITAGYEIDEASIPGLTFTPSTNWNGTTSFEWNGSDGLSYATSTALVNITIASVNDAPSVSAYTAAGTEDTRLYLTQTDFTTHFSDVDANSLAKIKFTTLPTLGTLMLVNTPIVQDQEIAFADIVNLNFAPDANWASTTTCQWSGSDGTVYASSAATITITINAVNDIPTISSPITKTGNEDETITFTLANFTDVFVDVDGTLGKIKIVSLPTNGTLKLNGTNIALNQEISNATIGQITFVPNLNWIGASSFLWNGSDGTAYAVADATVGITINAVNDLPAVSNFTLNGTEDTPLSFTAANFTSSYTDVESTLAKIKLATLPTNGQLKLSGTVLTANAEIAVDELASITYHPNSNWNGTETFGWNGSDGTAYATTNAITTINVAAVNDAPAFTSAANTSATQDSPYTYAITTSDIENNTLTITATTKPTWLTLTLTGAGTANLTGTPTQAQVGNHAVTLQVSDGTISTPQTFTLNVANINDKPTFTSAAVTTATEDVLYSYTITSTDIDGTIPNISMVEKPTWLTFTANTNGTAKLEGTPTNDNIGTFNVSIIVSDGLLDNTQSYQITVTNVNDKPVVNSQKTLSTTEEAAIALALSDLNVTDVDNTYPTGFSLELGAGTNYTLSGLNVTPSLNYNGVITVPARVNDGQSLNNLSDWFNVSITVTAVNDKPTISGLESTTLAYPENAAAVNISQAITTSDVDDTNLSGATVSITGYVASEDQLSFTNTASISGAWNSTSGALTLTGAATLADYNTALRSIKFQNTSENPTTTARQIAIFVTDGTDVSTILSRALQVTAVNDAPKSTNFSLSTKENLAKDIDMSSRITDAENNISWTTLTVSQQPTKGTVNVNTSTKTITYTPLAGTSGSDTFVYSICDLSGACSTGTVTILISDEAPDLVNDNASTPEDNAVTIDVLANDSDPQGNMAPSTLSILKAPTKGTAVVTTSFKILYTPAGNANGTDLLEYQVCDAQGYCSQASVNITIDAVNDSPTIVGDVASTNEDIAVLIDVLANDNDNKDPLGGIDAATITIVTPPTNGVAVVELGKIKYTPNTNYNGSDVLTYKVNDKGNPLPALDGQATVTITIDPVNDSPVISGQQTLSTDEDIPVTLSLGQLTVTDVDNSFPTNFTLTVLSGTNYTVSNAIVTPAANYYGTLTIPVRVSDGMSANSASNTFNLTMTVNPINDAPVANVDLVYTGENTPINFSVIGNDSDPNDAQGGINSDLLQIVKAPKSGSAVILPNKNINYTPYLGFSGKDTIEYSIGDIGYPLPAKTTTAKIFIEVFRLSPLANNDVASTNEDTPVSINLLANDTDSGNDINPNSITIVTAPTHGTLSAPSSGAVTYTPSANYFGSDVFTYTIKDFTNLPSNAANVNISIAAVNDAPVAVSTSYNTPENIALTLSMTDLLTDVDDNINYASMVITQLPTNGSTSIDTPNKKIKYTPSVGFAGTDKFKLKVSDLSGVTSNEATITIVVSNQAPKANNDLVTTAEDQIKTIDVTANDTDPQNNLNPASVTIVTQPRNGSVTVNPTTGQLAYTPNSNFAGLDSLVYSVCDLNSYCDEAKVNIVITAVNDAPVAVADAFDLFEDTQAALNLLANDTDLENNIDPQTFSVQTEPLHGKLEVNLVTGTVTYKPNLNYFGSDQFTYRICDSGTACSNNATVTLTVISVNDAPDAVDDAFVGYAGTPVSLSLWMNDTDVDGNLSPSTTTLVTQPKFGTAALKSGGIVVYTANNDYTGSDSFSYRICDTNGDCDVATVNLSIFSGNIAPATNSDKISTAEDTPVKVLPLSNDSDPNGNLDASTLKIVTQPTNGTAALNIATGEITYTPNDNFYGQDLLVYEVCDNDVNMPLCSSDKVYITIVSANDAPVAVDDHVTVFDNKQTSFNILLNDSDIDGDVLTTTLTVLPNLPNILDSLSLSTTGLFTIKPQLGQYCQTLTFEYRVCDTYNLCQTAEITVEIDALDSDGDGLSDYTEGLDANTDNDAQKNYMDTDSDNDGILDATESGTTDICNAIPVDTDNDGKPDYLDEESDNDGVSDKEEGAEDCDKDSTPNYRDYFDDCANRQKIPETFSPNNDGINDYLVIPVVTDYPTNELVVYNRWGNEVFRISNYNNTDKVWDGRASKSSMGTDVLPEGTYFYILTLGNGELTLHGSIYIKR